MCQMDNERIAAVKLVKLLHVGHLAQQPDQRGSNLTDSIFALLPQQEGLLPFVRGYQPAPGTPTPGTSWSCNPAAAATIIIFFCVQA
mmetsp:Transcript_91197/g.158100  ORF Transcript_91197/g.158100 Transcript_91197/m.158100 type:complete len:87 (+) Transcript_91197:320-580(+)